MIEDLQRIIDKIKKDRKIDFSGYKHTNLIRRISRRINDVKAKSYDDYIDLLDSNPEEYDKLLSIIYINATRFFRDVEPFTILENDVLPSVFAKKDGSDNTIRVWSAGCASGEETYSIAILLDEIIRRQKKEYRISLYGTDADFGAIEEARRGIYRPESFKDVSDEKRSRYFKPIDDKTGFKISSSIRGLAKFGTHDLASDPPISNLDILVCRNVVIYFSKKLQQKLFPIFCYALKEGGFLFLGKAETLPREVAHHFNEVDKKWRIYQKTERT